MEAGDPWNCDACGSSLRVASLDPLEFDGDEDDDDEDDEEDDEEVEEDEDDDLDDDSDDDDDADKEDWDESVQVLRTTASSDVPIGRLPTRSQAASTRSAASNSALTGRGGTDRYAPDGF